MKYPLFWSYQVYLILSELLWLYWVVPESVDWLIGAGRLEEAKAIIENAAKANGREAPVHLFKTATIVLSDIDNTKLLRLRNLFLIYSDQLKWHSGQSTCAFR